MQALAERWPDSIRLAEDEEIMPGIRTFWLGCHSDCSQAIAVQTKRGIAVFTVMLSTNIAISRKIYLLAGLMPMSVAMLCR